MEVRQRPEDAASYITVSDPVQQQDGMNKYTSYRVDVRGGPTPEIEGEGHHALPGSSVFQNPGYSAVLRRYSDFLWLFERLHAERGGAVVPHLPEKQPVGRFSAAFIEDRRRNLERFLRRVVVHPELRDAACVDTFLRADDAAFAVAKATDHRSAAAAAAAHDDAADMASRHAVSARSGGGGLRLPSWLASASASVANSLVGAPDLVRSPDDDLFDEIGRYVHGLDGQMRTVSQQASDLVRRGRDIANGMFEFGLAFSSLGQSEADGLGAALQRMGDAADALSVVTAEHVEREARDFEDPVRDYLRTIGAVKLALQKRNERRRTYSTSLHNVTQRQTALFKVRGVVGQEEKAYAAEMALARAREDSEAAREDFATVSQRLLREVDRFKREKAEDMRRTVMDYVHLQIEYNRRMEEVWAGLIPQLERITLDNANGAMASPAEATTTTSTAGSGAPYA